MAKFPYYKQADHKDCGPTCLKIIAKHHGKSLNIQKLREYTETTREGSNLMCMSDAAEKLGFRSMGVKINLLKLEEVPLPCILHWNKGHYVVLYKVPERQRSEMFSKLWKKDKTYYVSDPAIGLLEYDEKSFLKSWIGNNASQTTEEGIVLLLEPSPKFYQSESDVDPKNKFGFALLVKYVLPYKSFMIQLAIGLLVGTMLQIVSPFFTQSVMDIGIRNQNISFVYMMLVAQLFLFVGTTTLSIIQSWIVLHLSARINISLISDFFVKLMNLPISFFDTRITGDIMQRINDHSRIEKILTTSSLTILFSFINMIVMGGVLAYYNLKIFIIFFTGSLFYFLWVTLFLKRREKLDYIRFAEVSQEQSKVIELINGMQEIKLHNAEREKRWGWEFVQARLFKVSMQGMILGQTQGIGSSIINQVKNIFIAFLSAKLVIDGQITLGMMMAISSIVGSLNGPIEHFIGFIQELQDARISLSRLSEIHEKEDETQQDETQTHDIPMDSNIVIHDLSFRYIGSDVNVLENLSLTIPTNKITAIVGTSGSGKTTLMKLLLKFYKPNAGTILVDNTDLENINQKSWRNHVGAVMQEGFIFNDTIANNIAIGMESINKKRLVYAADVANITSYVSGLPLGYNTKIGVEGVGMSTGQKQRLLIARAVYKNPEMLFFDEATSSLDSNNERKIMQKLDLFFKNKTVVVIAHRLSTVINADQIVVLEKGKIIELGNHEELVKRKGSYYELVRNQLQLGI
ncbi:peptidase domain-containing ABC transporter [Flavobacterium aquicola]|uniref:ATP-binding cassette subfamily B protein n=1 Tax=Flavobacterium aquicola TaxID=1682742 RepID=A0A3E0EPK3_9FLAO|nr:peptidase domain-containing ABC transporter [Flavobacterium aquicola]REH00099.1 ATP-binding cassette subfamily B protein [Flavobacterium aquicola]